AVRHASTPGPHDPATPTASTARSSTTSAPGGLVRKSTNTKTEPEYRAHAAIAHGPLRASQKPAPEQARITVQLMACVALSGRAVRSEPSSSGGRKATADHGPSVLDSPTSSHESAPTSSAATVRRSVGMAV